MVSVEQVQAALPHYSWALDSGGAGGCQFSGQRREGRSTSQASLSFLQQYFSSPAEAAAMLRHMRTEFGKTYTLTALPASGGFLYSMAAEQGSVSATGWYVPAGRGLLSGMFVPPQAPGVVAGELDGLRTLLQAAVADTGRAPTAARAGQCPALDTALVRKLLGTQAVKIESFGSDSCLASARSGILNFSRMGGLDAQTQAQLTESMRPADCANEAVPSLGTQAELSHRCTSGAKRAQVAFFVPGERHEFSFMPAGNQEPTPAQRADLIELARRAAAR